jgi:hypothetical protein
MADTVSIERQCASCHTVHVLVVTAKGFRAWDMGRGAFIQDAFPELDDGQRELIKTGMCGDCFDKLFEGMGLEDDADGEDVEPIEDADDLPSWLTVIIGSTPGAGQDANPGTPGVTPSGRTGEGVTPAQCVERALLGLTAEGQPATRGHLRAPTNDWPRCSTELPSLYSPVFETSPNICNRPATLLMAFTEAYVNSMAEHRCEDPECPIGNAGLDPKIRAQMLRHHVAICAMHLPLLVQTEANWVRDVGMETGIRKTFDLAVIGVETVSLLGGGHPEGAQVLDLRPITGVRAP